MHQVRGITTRLSRQAKTVGLKNASHKQVCIEPEDLQCQWARRRSKTPKFGENVMRRYGLTKHIRNSLTATADWFESEAGRRLVGRVTVVAFSLVVSLPFLLLFFIAASHGFNETFEPSPQIDNPELVYASIGFGTVFLAINMLPIFFASRIHAAISIPTALSCYLVPPMIHAEIIRLGGCIEEIAPETGLYSEYLYFTFVTWTNLGYGDLTPTGICRSVSVTVVTFGHISLAVLTGVVAAVVFDRRA